MGSRYFMPISAGTKADQPASVVSGLSTLGAAVDPTRLEQVTVGAIQEGSSSRH
jgi:hypothetical protein